MNLLYFIPPLALLSYITYRKTEYGVFVVLATTPAFLLRTHVWFVPTTWLELAIYTVAAVWAIKAIKKGCAEARLTYLLHNAKPFILPIALLFIALLLSALRANATERALGIIKHWFFDPILLSIIIIDTFKTLKCLRSLILAFSLSAWPIIFYGLYEYAAGTGMTIFGRLDSFFESPNYVGMYLGPLYAFISGFLLLDVLSRIKKSPSLFSLREHWYLFAWILSAGSALLLTKSFGTWIGLFGAVCAFALFLPSITTKKAVLIPLVFMITIIGALLVHQRFFTKPGNFNRYDEYWQANSLDMRAQIWRHSLHLTAKNPIWGIGLGDFQADYDAYIESLPEKEKPIEKHVLRPHNLFLDFWLETGILGLTAFLWIVILFYCQSIASFLKRHESYLVPSLAAMASLLVHGFVDTPYFKNDLSVLFWFIVTVNLVIVTNNRPVK